MRWGAALIVPALAASSALAAEGSGCRIAYRPPQADYWFGHLLAGCRDPLTLEPTTRVWPVGEGLLNALRAFLRQALRYEAAGPLSWPAERPASFCDRMYLWAEDEGARAPEMTRERKILQACSAGP